MTTSDSTPSLDGEMLPETTSFTEVAKSQIKESALITLTPLLVIVRVTIIFTLALLADVFVIMIISWSFGSVVNHYLFAAKLLEGIQLLSALGTAVAYIFYLIRSLFKDAKDTLEDIQAKSSKKEKLP